MSFATPSPPTWHWRSHPRETAMLGLLGCAAALAIAGVSDAMPTLGHAPKSTLASAPLPSSPSATERRDVAPEEALALNARIPVTDLPLTAAAPFAWGKANNVA